MVDQPTDLDTHRGMAAQKATDLRRLRSEVEADQEALRARQAELEDLLSAAPATDWSEAAEKARYLLGLLAQNLDASDVRRRKLIDRVMADFDHLLGNSPHGRDDPSR
jgi:peptidoglycan hydrolase CwlO-like protein